jgi:hypothetical protein
VAVSSLRSSRIGELDPLGADAAVPTDEAALGIDERDVMRGPQPLRV